MNTTRKTTLVITLSALIAGAAFATTEQKNNEESVNNKLELINLPTEVAEVADQKPCKNKHDLQDMTTISGQEAMRIAAVAVPGELSELELERENGVLVWEVTQIGVNGVETELMIDAKNGRLLAAEIEDDDD